MKDFLSVVQNIFVEKSKYICWKVSPECWVSWVAGAGDSPANSNPILSPGDSPGEATATAGAFYLSNVSDRQ